MTYVRICYVLELRSGGLWGTGRRLLEADMVTATCRHATGREIPCIPSTYIKGLLRRSLEEVVHHLKRLGIVDTEDIVEQIFGPLTPFRDSASPKPCNTVIAPLYPIKSFAIASQLVGGKPLEYLYREDVLEDPALYGEPHIRIDDRSARVATGALYRELRVVPYTVFYGEILHYLDEESRAIYIARALALAIASLSYRYSGRKTVAYTYIVRIEPEDLVNDSIVGMVLSKRSIPSLR